jgi:hypothetical protein
MPSAFSWQETCPEYAPDEQPPAAAPASGHSKGLLPSTELGVSELASGKETCAPGGVPRVDDGAGPFEQLALVQSSDTRERPKGIFTT